MYGKSFSNEFKNMPPSEGAFEIKLVLIILKAPPPVACMLAS